MWGWQDFTCYPKIKKPGNPGCPIVSLCGAPTEKISQFVDYHLRLHVETLPSSINNFLTKLQSLNNTPENTLLVTLDFSSLYTNVPHAPRSLKHESYPATPNRGPSRVNQPDLDEEQFWVWSSALPTNPWDSHWDQHGTPLYKHLYGQTWTRTFSLQYGGDTLMTHFWNHGEESLNNFIGEINQAHPTIKFTAKWSRESVFFFWLQPWS